MLHRPAVTPAGNVTFTYVVTDRSVRVNATGTAVITIRACSSPADPTRLEAVDDVYMARCNVSFTPAPSELLINNDISGAPVPQLAVTRVTQPSVGAVTAWFPNGSFVFAPPAQFSGERRPWGLGAAAGHAAAPSSHCTPADSPGRPSLATGHLRQPHCHIGRAPAPAPRPPQAPLPSTTQWPTPRSATRPR